MNRPQAKSSHACGLALPLALVYCGLVAYASLYPFVGWQSQGVMPWSFVTAPLPRYWSGFDVAINMLGYIPFGYLVAVAWRSAAKPYPAVLTTVLAGLLAFVMEGLQTYLPLRVSSNADWALNTLGAALGAMLAWVADSLGVLQWWAAIRGRSFSVGSGFALGLLLLWPLALLYPTPVPLGLGSGLGQWLELDTQALSDRAQSVVATFGWLVPLLMSYAVTPKLLHRVIFLCLLLAAAFGMTTLSNGLSFGPEHATIWLQKKYLWGLWGGLAIGLFLLFATRRFCWVLAFLLLVPQLLLLGLIAPDPYFNQTLSIWERGQFIRFYGATQWLGRLWPYAALILIVSNITFPHKNKISL